MAGDSVSEAFSFRPGTTVIELALAMGTMLLPCEEGFDWVLLTASTFCLPYSQPLASHTGT